MPPRSRSSEMPQRPSLRGSNLLRTSSSDSDPLHNRTVTERSRKTGDRRSLVGILPDSKKLGSRIAVLESQLGQAQKELKVLKVQLVSAEASKKDAKPQLKKSNKTAVRRPDVPAKDSPPVAEDTKEAESCISGETSDDPQQEAGVSECSEERKPEVLEVDTKDYVDQLHKGNKPLDASIDEAAASTNDDIEILKSKLEEKEKELEVHSADNKNLKNQLPKASSKLASAKAKNEEMSSRLSQLEEELEASKAIAAELNAKLEAAKGDKEVLEAEIKKMRVQTDQWRKAADVAAAVLAGGVEMNGMISEKCSSMDKHFGSSVFHTPVDGYTSFARSPGDADDLDDGGKHKGSGIRMFGDLWRKKGHKQQPGH